MIRILEVFREPIANGGQESFLMNMYRNIDRTKIQMDFMTPFTCDNPTLKDEIICMGGQVFTYDHTFGVNNNHAFKKSITDFLRNHVYTTIHIHSGSTYALMEGAKIAKKYGVKNIIVHSHCGGFANIKYYMIKTLSTYPLMKYPTHYCACSKLAAEWKFPKKIVENGLYSIIKNAIDLKRFRYDEKQRNEYRTQFGFHGKFVIGHIGRFAVQKNHSFLIDIFEQIALKRSDAELVLVGDGELKKEIERKVLDKKLVDRVKFLGLRHDIPELLNMMDAFVLPSFFEGLPVVGVEAQATGLPVFCSDRVTREFPMRELSYFMSLEEAPEKWAHEIIDTCSRLKRYGTTNEMIDAGYEIKSAAKKLEDFYLKIN